MRTIQQRFSGMLKHKIIIQKESQTADGVGGYVRGWQDVVTLWAKVKLSSGKERLFANQLQSETLIKFTVRYHEGITAGMRILFQDAPYNIRYVNEIDSDKRVMELIAEAGVA